VVLTGPMGAGKTTVGQRVASLLNRPFFDLDAVLREESGLDIPLIFQRYGEPTFRQLEEDAALRILDAPDPCVLALGGGALDGAAVAERCGRADIALVWLQVDADEVRRRLDAHAVASRPLLRDGGWAAWQALHDRRAAGWALADLHVDTRGRAPADLARSIHVWLG
jgi:shikimate kinase